MSIEPGIHHFVLVAEADFHKELTITDDTGAVIPLAGGAAVMTIKSTESDPDDTIVLSSTAGQDGDITLADTAPNCILDLPSAETTGLGWEHGKHDVYITPLGGLKERYIEGDINVRPRIV